MSTQAKVSIELIREVREMTGASLNDVRVALETSGGDRTKALAWLKERGAQIAQKRQGRAAAQGRVDMYLHHDGRVGAMVEVNCETDFVARTPDFVQFCKDLAMQVAAMAPKYLSAEDAPKTLDADDRKAQCLLEQPFIKDSSTTMGDLLKALIAKTGENVLIRRFARFMVGEAHES